MDLIFSPNSTTVKYQSMQCIQGARSTRGHDYNQPVQPIDMASTDHEVRITIAVKICSFYLTLLLFYTLVFSPAVLYTGLFSCCFIHWLFLTNQKMGTFLVRKVLGTVIPSLSDPPQSLGLQYL